MAIGKLLLKLGIDTTNLDKELGKVEKSMSKFGQNMSNLGSTLTQSLTLPIIGVGAAALKSFADMEKLENGLIAIMGSSEGAAIELEKLRKVAENPGLDVVNRNIVITNEQGMGDNIMYSRFITLLRELKLKSVSVAMTRNLNPLISQIEGCDGIVSDMDCPSQAVRVRALSLPSLLLQYSLFRCSNL